MFFVIAQPLGSSLQPCFGQVAIGAQLARMAYGVRMLAALTFAAVLAFSGCARRAYTDLYVENMAAEVRDLEDQLWEFDGEYRLLEHELEALQAENARLKGSLVNGSTKAGAPNSLAPPGSNQPRLLPVPNSGAASSQPSGLGSGGTSPNNSTGGLPNAAPSLDAAPATNPNSSSRTTPQGKTPNPLAPGNLPAPKAVPGANDPYDLKNLEPPTIEPGEIMPPTLPSPRLDRASPVSLGSQHELEVELGQIPIPAQLTAITSGGKLLAESGGSPVAWRDAAPQMPNDTRIVEMKFHPTLSRAVNLDEQGDDDGLYLVLQPLNEAGEFVPIAADLMVLAIDLSREEKQGNIGRWTFSTSDVKSKMQPIGSSQGIHLSLPFSGPPPQCDRVLVFVYYTLPDGRRLVEEQELLLNNHHRQSTVWVPRAKTNTLAPNGPVRAASGSRPVK